jgi:hypothetical protein
MHQDRFRISASTAQKVTGFTLLGVSAVLAAALVRFAVTGLASRYWSDDYCYSSVFAAGGLLRGPIDWFMTSGNRFSTIYLVGLQDWFGPSAIRFVPGLVLLALTLGWLVFLRAAARVVGEFTHPAFGAPPSRAGKSFFWSFWTPKASKSSVKFSALALTGLAMAQVFFLALLAPDRLQTIYWRMGALHYTFPLALLLLNLAACLGALSAARRERRGRAWLRGLGLFLLAFFAGGFSETFAALQAGVFALGCAAAVLLLPRKARLRGGGAFLPALLGSICAMGLMLLSPSNAWRQAALPPPANLGELLSYTLRYTLDFAGDTLRGAPLPLLVLAVLSGASAYVAFRRPGPPPFSPRQGGLLAILCLLAGLALSACAIAPSVYAGLQFPAGRALMPARFALLLGLTSASACIAVCLRQDAGALQGTGARRKVLLADLLLFLALLSTAIYLARHLSQPLPEQPRMAAWAQRWDQRDAQILNLRADGQTDLVLTETEVVRGLEDLGPNPSHWVNRCAAAYYQVNTILALP